MKIRNGFVSNSSSSSFVVLLPDNFDVTSFVETHWKDVDLSDFDFDDDADDDTAKAKVNEIVKKFIEDGEVYEGNEDDHLWLVRELFRDYIMADFDVSSDSGSGVILDNAEIRKILGC
jgi:hypothetical protein